MPCVESSTQTLLLPKHAKISTLIKSLKAGIWPTEAPTHIWHCECLKDISKSFSEDPMRSDLVFGAMTHVSNRFLLSKVLAKATRAFHRPGTRVQDTTNEVLARFGCANPISDENTGRVPAIVSIQRRAPQSVTSRRARSLLVPAAHQGPKALSEALRALGPYTVRIARSSA
jgi:hypothetical protein